MRPRVQLIHTSGTSGVGAGAHPNIELVTGDCRDVMPALPAGVFDACVTDPPYGIGIAAWDTDVPGTDVWLEVLRLLKPGAWLVAFGARRTYHRMATAVEDAGFEIFDMAVWVYLTGRAPSKDHLKPAHEPIVIARAPGARMPVNREACRIPWRDAADRKQASRINTLRARGKRRPVYSASLDRHGRGKFQSDAGGRLPATVMATDEVLGEASHILMVPKARNTGGHLCSKPTALLAHLVELFVPAGGVVLDPFAGSGSIAAPVSASGRRAVLIERAPPVADGDRMGGTA